MLLSVVYAFVILFQIYNNVSLAKEPVCSKFSFQEQLLEKMIRTEIKVETMENAIKKTQDTVMNTLNEIKATAADMVDKFENLRNNITKEMELKTRDLEKLAEKMTGTSIGIAFHAYDVTDLIQDKTNEIIIFGKTITNEGMGYDTSTGIFTAPLEGMYQFTVHVCAATSKFSFVGLAMEGKVVAKSANHDKDMYTCTSAGAVVRMKSGEQVWVKCTSSSTNRVLFRSHVAMNTFSGTFLYK